MEPIIPCPHARKVKYPNAREACEALIAIKSNPPGEGQYQPISFYECRCGGWHLSSKPQQSAEHARRRGMPPPPGQRVPDPPKKDDHA